ncbi:GNAT family N-acetyltransferase [Lysinibacillus sp. MHQ-1]|nr:GNAT family N-acetyltransferase [Lysinibacillus sp. MHQ-1]
MHSYENDDNWVLYLWKKNDEYVGIVGLVTDENNTATIQHVSVVPSYRGEGVAKEMLQEIGVLGQYEHVRATDETRQLVQKMYQLHRKKSRRVTSSAHTVDKSHRAFTLSMAFAILNW